MPATTHKNMVLTVPVDINPLDRWQYVFERVMMRADPSFYGYLQINYEAGRITTVRHDYTEKPP